MLAFFMLLLWGLSPVGLIVAVVLLACGRSEWRKKARRMAGALNSLYQDGRISKEEVLRATSGERPPAPPNTVRIPAPAVRADTAAPMYSRPPVRPPVRVQAPPPACTNAYTNSPPAYSAPIQNAEPVHAVAPTAESAPQPQAGAPDKLNPSTIGILLILGVVFILLAGLVFATTAWHYLPDFARVLVILSVTLLFFGASALAERRLKMWESGRAFFVLGSLFIPLSALAISGLRLLGPWLSLGGRGAGLLFLVGAALLGLCALHGAEKYRSKILAWLSLCCLPLCAVSAASLLPWGPAWLGLGLYTSALFLGANRLAGLAGQWPRLAPALTRVRLFSFAQLLAFVACFSSVALFQLLTTLEPSILFAIAVVFATFTAGAYSRRSRFFIYAQAPAFITLNFALVSLLPDYPEVRGFAFAALCACGFALCVLLERLDGLPLPDVRPGIQLRGFVPRTAVSDSICLCGCLLGIWLDNSSLGQLATAALLCAMTAFLALERGTRRRTAVALWLLPLITTLLLPPLTQLTGASAEALLFTHFLLLGGVAMLLLCLPQPRVQAVAVRLELPLLATLLVLAAACTGADGRWIACTCLWVLVAYCALNQVLLFAGRPGAVGRFLCERGLFGLTAAGVLFASFVSMCLLLPIPRFAYALCAPAALCLLAWCAWLALRDLPLAPPLLSLGRRLHALGTLGMGIFAAVLSFLCLGSDIPLWFALPCALLSGLAFYAIRLARRPMLEFLPLLGYYPLLFSAAQSLSSRAAPGLLTGVTALCGYAGAMALSCVFYRRLYTLRDGKLIQVDWFAALALLAPCFQFAANETVWFLTGILLHMVWCVLAARRIPHGGARSALYLVCAMLFVPAWWIQPFWRPGPLLATEWGMLALCVPCWAAWRLYPLHAASVKRVQYGISIGCTALLGAESLLLGRVGDSLLLGCAALALLGYSLFARRRRWLVLASITLTAMALYGTRRFWFILPWWLYLLVAGLALIGTAAAGELCRQHGEALPRRIAQRLSGFLRDWPW